MRFYIKQGDTAPAIRKTLLDPQGDPVNLTGATVRFYMRQSSDGVFDTPGETLISGDAIVVTPSGGVVQYQWGANDTAEPGLYDAEFEVTYSDGYVEKFPNAKDFSVLVSRSVKEA